MKIAQINEILAQSTIEELPVVMEQFKSDERQGVQKLLQKYTKKLEAYDQLCQDFELRRYFDTAFEEEGTCLVGIDEVGRGPLAGPVVASAVILPEDCLLLGIKDSKKLTEAKREALYDEIMEQALYVGVGIVDANRIDEINILQATFEAMRCALTQIADQPKVILVDGDKEIPQVEAKQHAIIGGDDKSATIGAASIIAKVTRDRMMKAYSKEYPGYGWESNKGYGSSSHYDGIRSLGITPLHRKSFLKNEGIR